MNQPQDDPRLKRVVAQQPYPLLFVTISGAHLYGFPSPDSDYDLRGVHLLPAAEVVGLKELKETTEISRTPEQAEGLELDMVTHDVKKFMAMMLKRNGYVLEQLYSPLIVHATPEHDELKEIGRRCVTRHHVHHYLGFAQTQWKLFAKESPPRVKPLLYVYRVLLTGIHLMRTGEVEANLLRLNAKYGLPFIDELVARKLAGVEKGKLENADMSFHEQQYQHLLRQLQEAGEQTHLPEMPAGRDDLHELLLCLRLPERLRSADQ